MIYLDSRSLSLNDRRAGATGCSRRLLSCVAVSVLLQRLPGRLSLPSSGCRSCGICDGGGVISPQRGFQLAEMSTGDCDCRRLCTLRLLASSRVERSVGRFSRLRTPLGLVMRRLSETAIERPAVSPMPPCTQRLCRIGQACARRRLPRWTFSSLSGAHHCASPIAPRPGFAQTALHQRSAALASSGVPLETGYFGPRGWLSNEIYGEHVLKVGQCREYSFGRRTAARRS
ncbi:hypothetical protein ALC62_10704 [Cyphomyrmex costatus]|uniref:Uncharacterized protein n=1 Tax=Cyphomyrmex costatus TaxID=456900 RepID=A0A195CET3_9HYME|nr:hypothetical protein ALC62_10704 [Cyphomyrmex costatus]